ncbi:MAG: type sorting protein, partial [Segetibacter sp.]|nr:type sorting protein [Segetibacter sp.]
LVCLITAKSQLLTWSPDFIHESSDPVTITVDATKGNQGLKGYTPTSDVYVHIGIITSFSTSSSDWKHVKYSSFNSPSPTVQTTYTGPNQWTFTITGGLRAFFGVTDPAETIQKIAVLFRNGPGTRVQRNTDGSDMYIPVYDAGLYVRLDQPFKEPKYTPTAEPVNKTLGDNIPVSAKASQNSTLKLFLNGTQVGSTATDATSVTANAVISSYGTQTIIAEATNATGTKYDTISFFVTPQTTVAELPAGVRDGINYEPGDTSVTLVLFAPYKTRASVVGDFNNWTETTLHQMNKTPDNNRYWVRITGLTPGAEYAYQYLVDGTLKVADYMTEKVLDPANDQFIPAANYPNLKPYPTGKTSGIVSVLQTAKPTYTWQVNNFTKPDKRNLIIYELLVRDFVATQNWQTVKDSISYLKKLGINAIEVMPFNEFEGNNSWGYNPDFFFAPDKMYGTETALRQFIDECHRQGIAVIMDIAMNHAFGLSPTVQMYWNGALNRPAANNPWHNEVAKHPFNVGFDFNHESAATKALVGRVIEHWLTKYKIDGFRWDLSKGFTQVNSCTTGDCSSGAEVNNWSQYDASRVALWKGYYDTMQAKAPASYCILEHFAANQEETELSNYGMLLWGNANYFFNQATMGYLDNNSSNFESGIYTQRGWINPNLITYQESHDEERLMFKNEQYGNSNGTYNVKDINTGLKRNEMATAFWAMIPAPKMLWQFGELGYDYSINTCENLTIANECRLSPKPIRWDYLANPNRLALHDVYAKLFKLRNVPNFLPTFVTNNVTYSLGGSVKTLQVNSDSLKITVIGNFDISTTTGSVTFQDAGTWYDYLLGGTRTATGAAESITLQPGEYHVYTNRDVSGLIALPLKLLSFGAKRNSNNITIAWVTTNEVNVKHFAVERSFNGVDFRNIATVTAKNITIQQIPYNYADIDPSAVNSDKNVYYRLKMIDKDGQYSYSNVAVVDASQHHSNLSLYPNPAKGSQVYLTLNEPIRSGTKVKVEDVSGRLYKNYTISVTGSNKTIPVDVKSLPSGVYIIKVETSKGSAVKQFIIQH